ncbi:MAG: dipeptide epimerase [Verrucomicrobia bacterium]|nr:dipeptide epimerase [Verrucomicrobiota bacterium]
MDLSFQFLRLRKRTPLAISRGASAESVLAWIRVRSEGVEGWGEAGEYSIGTHRVFPTELEANLQRAQSVLERLPAADRAAADAVLRKQGIDSSTRAGINQALIDWLGKRQGMSAGTLLGIPERPSPPTSVTVGINTPEAAAARVRLWLRTASFRVWKLKMGSPGGVGADQAMYETVIQAIPAGSRVSVDANGGWTLDQAREMAGWLADRGVDHIEQPLPRGQERDLPSLRARSPIAILADESCLDSSEITALAEAVDGVNIKLFKCGGVDPALRMIQSARDHGMKVMLGCYGNTLLGNTALARLGGLADYVDLDSHWNLEGDPFKGATLSDGVLQAPEGPGFGVSTHDTTD